MDSIRRLGDRKWGIQVRVLSTVVEVESIGWSEKQDY